MSFDMTPFVARGFNNSVAVQSGPLVFSLPLQGKWAKVASYGNTKSADWTVTPGRPFNYALDLDQGNVASVAVHRTTPSQVPFADDAPPVKIMVSAKLLPEWSADSPENNYAKDPPKSPVLSEKVLQFLDLQPFGSTRLRITSFPSLRS